MTSIYQPAKKPGIFEGCDSLETEDSEILIVAHGHPGSSDLWSSLHPPLHHSCVTSANSVLKCEAFSMWGN